MITWLRAGMMMISMMQLYVKHDLFRLLNAMIWIFIKKLPQCL